MNSTAILRLDQTERTFSLTITFPRPRFRLPRWARRSEAEQPLRTEEALRWEKTSFSKEHGAELAHKRFQ